MYVYRTETIQSRADFGKSISTIVNNALPYAYFRRECINDPATLPVAAVADTGKSRYNPAIGNFLRGREIEKTLLLIFLSEAM